MWGRRGNQQQCWGLKSAISQMLERVSDSISVNFLILYHKIQIKIQNIVVCGYGGQLVHSGFIFMS